MATVFGQVFMAVESAWVLKTQVFKVLKTTKSSKAQFKVFFHFV